MEAQRQYRRWAVGSVLLVLTSVAGLLAVMLLPTGPALAVGVVLGVLVAAALVGSRWAVLRAGGASRRRAAVMTAAITLVVGGVVWVLSQPLSEVGWLVLTAAGAAVLFWPERVYLTRARASRVLG